MGVIVGTAGHIDHGKSTLMLALTGRDPDRLKEEKARGITIELGYVFLKDGDGGDISFIDVPGHEKFVRTMVAGVATVDCFLLVVSADEGVMPQTREHLDILRLLEVDRGIVALSKCDLVDEELTELAEQDVRDALAGTPAEASPIIRVSARTGAGIPELRAALLAMASSLQARNSGGRFRMPVDRLFKLKGFGTIVCGTALSGSVSVGDTVEILPSEKTFRVREMGVNDTRNVKQGNAGERIALNLTGIREEDVDRGSVVADPGYLRKLKSLDTRCTMLSSGIDLVPRQRVRFHVGTAEVMARAIPVEAGPLVRGATGYVHFQLETPVVALPGDRFVLRRYSPVITIGGGVILDTGTRKVREKFRETRLEHLDLLTHGDLEDLLYETLEDSPWNCVDPAEFIARTGVEPGDYETAASALVVQGRAVSAGEGRSARLLLKAALDDMERKITGAVGTMHRGVPLSPGLPSSQLARKLPRDAPVWLVRLAVDRLIREDSLEKRGDFLALKTFPGELQGDARTLAEMISSHAGKAGFEGMLLPAPAFREEDIQALLARGVLFRLSENLVSTEAVLERVVHVARESFKGDLFRLGELREKLGVSRRITLMWAEVLDGRMITARDGEQRRIL